MEISQEDRLKILQEMARDVGVSEREDDEFTAQELAEEFNIYRTALIQYFDSHEIKHTRRKAIVDGRRQFVYKLIKEAL